ncbi:DUF2721 domain-containing protein [Thiorhodococcus minor]|uniref:DUF2721 domain-containing protein n=1 Tax=Thiorhodococcus minor TaxID=57489 RepID=A0A6M0JY21_9GAMM|nr:DUF2721 domain-containing protein [Thiorhodococcus minor]NEV61901.1 DUF2721 domain-containing protein [Thiorhodococcus minor]
MLQEAPIANVAHVIQLAVAPVFLLTGISGMLAVMTNRLGRIVDRARVVEEQLASADGVSLFADELPLLSHRARLISLSISLCTLTALLVASVIAILFLGAFATFDASILVAACFVAAMAAFIVALIFFLREIFLALSTLKFGKAR